jgi:hypothetical protein
VGAKLGYEIGAGLSLMLGRLEEFFASYKACNGYYKMKEGKIMRRNTGTFH